MNQLLKEIRHSPPLWPLAFVPVMYAAAKFKPEAHALFFVLFVPAIVPLAALARLRIRSWTELSKLICPNSFIHKMLRSCRH